MNTSKHTPGPWVVSDDGDITLIIHAPKDEVDIARMSNDCEMFSEIRANAHLIAATPAMYKALQAIEARLQGNFDHPALIMHGMLTHDRAADVLRFARAAIAQAKGR